MTTTPYKRVLLKLSGESLLGSQSFGIDINATTHIAQILKQMRDSGLQVALVIGGGNIFRGIHSKMSRTPADQMGMLATMMNGLALQQSLISIDCPTQVFSALDCPKVVQSYQWQSVMNALDKGDIVIFVGGTGNPYFTTDTAAALRASEIKADVLLKATKVDGIYDKDPMKHQDATLYRQISYSKILSDDLKVMDATSIALCRDNRVPIYVFNMNLLKNKTLSQIITEQTTGTLVKGE